MARYTFSVITRNPVNYLDYSGFTEDLNITLPEDTYFWGIDQSSSSTGFYLTNSKFAFHIIGEISPTEGTRHEFYSQLRNFFAVLLGKAKLRFFISEKVPQVQGKGYYSSTILKELKGVIGQWFETIPAIRDMPAEGFDDIVKSAWASQIIDKSKGKGRFHKKAAVVEDICDRFPELKIYKLRNRSKDFDAFEACGILHGYLLKNFQGVKGGTTSATSAAGGQLIAGDKSYKGNLYVFFTTVPENKQIKLDEIEGFLNISIMKHGCKHLNINTNYSLFSNYLMAASKFPITVTIVEDLQMKLTLQWQLGLEMNNDHIVAFIVRQGAIHGSDLPHLKRTFKYDQIR